MRSIWLISKTVLIESIRRKEIYVVVLAASLMIGMVMMMDFFNLQGLTKFYREVALKVTSIATALTVLVLASIGLGAATGGLVCASILLISVSIGGDMQQDRSTGWRLGTNRVNQFRYQVVGVTMGAVLAVAMAGFFMSANPVLYVDQTDAKARQAYLLAKATPELEKVRAPADPPVAEWGRLASELAPLAKDKKLSPVQEAQWKKWETATAPYQQEIDRWQSTQLAHAARVAKEALLGDDSMQSAPIVIAGRRPGIDVPRPTLPTAHGH